MRNDPEFNIEFIQLVEKFPILYDYRRRDNSCKAEVEKAWAEVGNQCNEPGSACREKWNNLRGNFSRSLRPPKNASGTKRDYYLTKYMQFLLPFMKSRPQCGSVVETDSSHCSDAVSPGCSADYDDASADILELEKSVDENDDHESRSEATESLGNAVMTIIEQKSSKTKIFAKRKRSNESFEKGVIDYLVPKKHKSTALEDSPDLNFFKSILPEVGTLAPFKKTSFRIGVLKLLNALLTGSSE